MSRGDQQHGAPVRGSSMTDASYTAVGDGSGELPNNRALRLQKNIVAMEAKVRGGAGNFFYSKGEVNTLLGLWMFTTGLDAFSVKLSIGWFTTAAECVKYGVMVLSLLHFSSFLLNYSLEASRKKDETFYAPANSDAHVLSLKGKMNAVRFVADICTVVGAYFLTPDYITTHDAGTSLGFGWGAAFLMAAAVLRMYATYSLEYKLATYAMQKYVQPTTSVEGKRTPVLLWGVACVVAAGAAALTGYKLGHLPGGFAVGIGLMFLGLLLINLASTHEVTAKMDAVSGRNTKRAYHRCGLRLSHRMLDELQHVTWVWSSAYIFFNGLNFAQKDPQYILTSLFVSVSFSLLLGTYFAAGRKSRYTALAATTPAANVVRPQMAQSSV